MKEPLMGIFDNQRTLVAKYVEAGKQKQWPLSLDDKENQAFIRELFGFLEEEIFEAYKPLEDMSVILRDHNPAEIGNKATLQYLNEFNEEVADTMALFIEVFDYVNIDFHSIRLYYEKLLEVTDQLPLIKDGDTLGTAINYSELILGLSHQLNSKTLRIKAVNLPLHNGFDEITAFNLPLGGQLISAQIVNLSQNYIFHCIKHIQIARNCLKMKYWRENGDATNIDKFHNHLMEAWLNYMVFLYLNGFTSSVAIHWLHSQKTTKNLERVQTGW